MKVKFLNGLLFLSLFFMMGFSKCHDVESASPSTEILGMWVLENDAITKVEFLANGTVKNYRGNSWQSTDHWAITNVAEDGTTSAGVMYLKLTFTEGDSFYYLINGINEDNSGVLSLTTMNQGKLVVYVRP